MLNITFSKYKNSGSNVSEAKDAAKKLITEYPESKIFVYPTGSSKLYFDEEAQEYYAYSRIGTDEIGETDVGGNGISGHNKTIKQIWHSKELNKLRKLHLEKKRHKYNPCDRCGL